MKRMSFVVAACLFAFLSSHALALITGAMGNDPVTDPGWPKGALEVANLKSRVAYWEGPPFGGGQYQHLYRGDTEAFNAALATFSKMRTPVRELVIHDGPHTSFYMKIDRGDAKKLDPRIDWSFTVWIPAHWHQLYSAPGREYFAEDPNYGKDLDPPRMEVYIGGGQIDWSKVKLPTNLRVIDKRAATAGVKVEGGAVVHVNAYDMATGKPVEGAVLRINERSEKAAEIAQAKSNADGFIEAVKIPAGIVRLTIEAPGYATRLIAYEELAATTFRSYDIELSKVAALTGTVVDEAGKPLANVTVTASTMGIDGRGYNQVGPAQVKTDAQGRYAFTGLPTGYARIVARLTGHEQQDFLKVHPIPSAQLTLKLTATGASKGK